jgi:hypothetical protein
MIASNFAHGASSAAANSHAKLPSDGLARGPQLVGRHFVAIQGIDGNACRSEGIDAARAIMEA